MDWLTVALMVFMSGVLYSAIFGPLKLYSRISIPRWALPYHYYPLVIISLGTGGDHVPYAAEVVLLQNNCLTS